MKSGMVGCAFSHLKLYVNLVNSKEDCYLIFEDDITFHPKFMEKFSALTMNLPHNWDFIFLGHIPKSGFSGFSENLQLQKWNTEKSLSESLGGTMGYMVSKKGATAFLEFINKTGMTNCIDTMIQKMANFGNIYYCIPQLIYSPYEPEKGDVQTNYNSLSLGRPVNNNLYSERLKVNGVFNIDMAIKYEDID
jgi:GR25 family glycosyltransferase involved in LPS biosynthesis